jgi:hypothetical protein
MFHPNRKSKKPQKGNPHGLAVWQHVFPASCIRRFVDNEGFVSVWRCSPGRAIRVRPDDKLFCGERAWDQRAESGYMNEIENNFHSLAEDVVQGMKTIPENKSGIITKFFALWTLRFNAKVAPRPDQPIVGVVGEPLSKDEEEILERNHIGFIDKAGVRPVTCPPENSPLEM